MQTAQQLLTVEEVATRLRVDETTVRRWIRSGALPAVALPHRGKRQVYRVHTDTIRRIIEGETKP